MTELSVTVTFGIGSECHNHDLDYRDALEHVTSRPDGVVELIPYRPYNIVINEYMKPYIDAYNAKVGERYEAALQRHKMGQIKSKPSRSSYKQMSEFFAEEHRTKKHHNPQTGKTEERPLFRSIIIGIGDEEDRKSGRVTESQVLAIFIRARDQLIEAFPGFLFLGFSLHLDERGFYHAHLDFLSTYKKKPPYNGLEIEIGLDSALKSMGYLPEQSIINHSDKAPKVFNAFRNKIYHIMEVAMNEQGLFLQYGVSKWKDPEKDSSRNQPLEEWQIKRDYLRARQHQRNIAADSHPEETVSYKEYRYATMSIEELMHVFSRIFACPKLLLQNNYRVPDELMQEAMLKLKDVYDCVMSPILKLEEKQKELDEALSYRTKFESLLENYNDLQKRSNYLANEYMKLRANGEELQKNFDKAREHMKRYVLLDGRNIWQVFQEPQKLIEERTKPTEEHATSEHATQEGKKKKPKERER